MNYQRIYLCIVLRAQREYDERKANKKNNGAYYEVHHILPRSLGGNNDKSNLAMLTAREHFICHWLLVKMYPKGSIERDKMIFAIWCMQSESNTQQGQRYINAHVYETIRTEYRAVVSRRQSGTGNSLYGNHWYTNAHNGVALHSSLDLEYPWYRGKTLFRGEFCHLAYDDHMKSIPKKTILRPNMIHKTKPNKDICRSAEQYRAQQRLRAIDETKKLWDEFHSSQYSSLGEWGRTHDISYQAIRKRFKNFIPIFNNLLQHGVPFASNKSLIGVYKMDG